MYTHLIIGGGGVKGCVITGSLEAMDTVFNINRIKYIIGSSVGGIIGLLISLNFTPKEITYIFLNINLIDYRQIKISNLINKFGVDDGKKIIRLIKSIILQKYDRWDYTFKDLYKMTGKTLILTGSNITKNKIVYFSRYKYPTMKVIDAIKITTCYPILYQPIILNGDYYIDGAALDNYPASYFKHIKRKIGISLENNVQPNENMHNITNLLNYSGAIIFSIVEKYNDIKKKKYADSTVLIKLPAIHALEYGISYNTKLKIRNIGYNTTMQYLNNTINGFYKTLLLKRYFKKLKN
jgi:predicted acylesterase/phospholipase RssA